MIENKTNSRLIKNAVVWSFAAELTAKLIVPITNMILARILAPEAFGVIATINLIVTFADMISTSGISKYIVQKNFNSEEELYRNADVAFWTNSFISIFGWIIIAVFRFPICRWVGNVGYEIPLVIASLSLPLTAFSSIQESFFQRYFNYKALFYRRCAVSLLPFFITIPLALCGYSYWALIIGNLAGNVLKIVILSIYSKWKPSLYFSFKMLKNMSSFCVWMVLGAIASWSVSSIDILIISNRLGEYYTGLYKNSQSTVTGLISIITASITSVLFASLSREQNNPDKFESLLFSFQRKISIFVIPMGIGIFFYSELITKILLGSQWLEASGFIGIWGLSSALYCIFADFCREAFRAKGRPKITFYVQIIYIFFLIPVCYFSVDKGFEFLGIVRSAANLHMIFLYFVAIFIFLKISPLKMIKNIKEPIFCSLIMGAIAWFIAPFIKGNYLMQFLSIIFLTIVYFSILFMFKSYRNDLLKIIKEFRKKFRKGAVNHHE